MSQSVKARAAAVLRWLEAHGTKRNREGMPRYGIRSAKAFGVSAATLRPLARRLGRDHELALALWQTGWHEARILASCIEDPRSVTPRQMEAWARDFDNWAVCDAVCYQLFDHTPYAVEKIHAWSARRSEFVKRGAFAIMAGLAVHDKAGPDAKFVAFFRLIERAADDERNFVMKAVNWALRQIGKRGIALRAAAIEVADRISRRASPSARWIGRNALRELRSHAVEARLARRGMTQPNAGRHTEQNRVRRPNR